MSFPLYMGVNNAYCFLGEIITPNLSGKLGKLMHVDV